MDLDPEDPKQHTVRNPRLLVEVFGPSTADYDRGEKLEHYKRIESLHEILLVDPQTQSVTKWSRSDLGWSEHNYTDGGVPLETTDTPLPLADAFRDPLKG